MQVISKYLTTYAEVSHLSKITSQLDMENFPCHDLAVVIPARNEAIELQKTLASIETSHANKKILIIIVANSNGSDEQEHLAMLDILDIKHNALVHINRKNNFLTYCVLNFSTFSGIPFSKKDGVGLARKIGFDLATYLFQSNKISSPYIRSLDADVTIDNQYFQEDFESDLSAVIFPFKHEGQQKSLSQSLALYEVYLHYHCSGLQYAGSDYGFHALGSSFAIHVKDYCLVRGFPKRQAGEDFYIISKLVKMGRVKSVITPYIHIRDRVSTRTPFGTGAAQANYDQALLNNELILFPHPKTYSALKSILEQLIAFASHRNQTLFLSNIYRAMSNLDMNPSVTWPKINTVLDLKKLEKLSQNFKDTHNLQRQIRTWFDGLRQLQVINILSTCDYPPLAWEKCIKQASWLKDLYVNTSIQNPLVISTAMTELLAKSLPRYHSII